MTRFLPILGWLPRYERRWLPADALAGLSVWALLVPQSLAYATLAGVPVQYGLYTAFAALLMYPVFGTSRQLAEGPSAAVCAVVAATITPLVGAAALGTDAAAPYAAALALATGVVYVVLGVLRMGWVSTFLSKAVPSSEWTWLMMIPIAKPRMNPAMTALDRNVETQPMRRTPSTTYTTPVASASAAA